MNIFRASPSVLAEAAIKAAQGEMKPAPVVPDLKAVAATLSAPVDDAKGKGKAKAGK